MPKKPKVHKLEVKQPPAGFIRKRMREGYVPTRIKSYRMPALPKPPKLKKKKLTKKGALEAVLEIGTRWGYRRMRKEAEVIPPQFFEPILWPLLAAPAGALAGSIADAETAKRYAIHAGMGGLGAGLARYGSHLLTKNPRIATPAGAIGFGGGLLLSPLVLNALGYDAVD